MSSLAASVVVGVGGAIAGAVASDKASKRAAKTADNTLAYQERIAAQQREDFAPFQQVGYDVLPEYYRMLGIMPSLTEQERLELEDYADWQAQPAATRPKTWTGDWGMLERAQTKQQMIDTWDTTGGAAPELSPLAKWQMQQANQAQGRADSARGLSGSGGASRRETDTASAIAGQDYLNQYSRILDALKVGQGAAGQAGASSQQLSQQVGVAGQNQMNIQLDRGQNQANLWSGLGSVPMDLYSMSLRAPGSSAPAGGGSPIYTPSGGGTRGSDFLI